MKKSNNSGLSLVELLVAIVILGIVSGCIISVINTSMKISVSTNESMHAANTTNNIHELWIKHSLKDGKNFDNFTDTLFLLYKDECNKNESNEYIQTTVNTSHSSPVSLSAYTENSVSYSVYNDTSNSAIYICFTSIWKQCDYSEAVYYAVIKPFTYESIITDISIEIYSCAVSGEIGDNDKLLYNFTEVTEDETQAP